MSHARVIAIGNNKGGTAKTTTAINLAKGLADVGNKVLLIDADPQGNATSASGVDEPDELDITLTTVMMKEIRGENYPADLAILQNQNGFDLLPGNIELSELEFVLVNTMSRECILRSIIRSLRPVYDYIIIDCAPSLGTLTTNAFVAADSVLIPVQPSYMPVKGLEQLVKYITRIRKHINPDFSIEGILLTMVDQRNNFTKEIIDLVQDSYGQNVRVFQEFIPRSVRAEESSAEGISIFEHDPKGKVASAYRSLIKEVVQNEKGQVQAHGER